METGKLRQRGMVSVVGNDAGTVLHTDNELNTSTDRAIMQAENPKTLTPTPATNPIETDDPTETSGIRIRNDVENDEQQPQCSGQQNLIEQSEKSTSEVNAMNAQAEKIAARQNSVHSCELRGKIQAGNCCQDEHRRNCATARATSSSISSVFPSISQPAADSVQRCGGMRRPNVSYASAARSSLTRRTLSAEESPSTSKVITGKLSKPPSAVATFHARQKLSKQMTVDETCSPIFLGEEEDCLQPTSNSRIRLKPLLSENQDHRPASVDVLRRPNGHPLGAQDRPRSVDVVVTSKPLRPSASKGPPETAKRKLIKSKSLAQTLSASIPDESTNEASADHGAPARTDEPHYPSPTGNQIPCGYKQSSQPQPISVNLPDEVDEMRPMRELLPERISGAPTLMRVEKHPYPGTVPSRTRQLVRSLAMCGDDDTRLRPPPPPMVNTFASVSSVGVPPRFHRNSSSLSRESSYTDYTADLTEVELRAFIAATLHKNARDRAMILELEQLFTDFVNEFGEQSLKLPPVSSYNRMLIHRVAVLFGLDHNVDNSGKCVVVSKTSKTKTPDFLFASLIQSNVYTDTRRFCPNYVGYMEVGPGDAMQRRAQSFETGYLYPSVDSDVVNPAHTWAQANQRSFEKQPHYSYQMGMVDRSTMMRKAGSFSGVPAIYRSGSGSFENYDRSQMKTGQAHSLASSSHLSPRDPIDETVERFNNASLSDRASQFSYRSTSSNPPSHQVMYQSYPQMMQYPVNEEVIYPPYQQQVYMQPTTMMTPTSVEIYPPQPTIVMPVPQTTVQQQQVPVMQCQPQEQIAQMPQTQLEQSQILSTHPDYVQYSAQHYPTQVMTCAPQQYQSLAHPPSYQTQYQQVIYPHQMVQQQLIQPQQYQPTFVQAPVQNLYQPTVVQAPMSQQYMAQQPVVHVQSPLYQQQAQQVRPRYSAMTMAPVAAQQYVDGAKAEQPATYQPVAYGQWQSTEQYQESTHESETVETSAGTEQTESQVTAPAPVPLQTPIGKTVMAPLSVLVNTEPMYHYSQTSPVMSSMQQQQMLQIQSHSRPLLYRPSPQYTAQQPSVDGGYCSMTQDSLRDSDVAADAQ
ncbi:unnamed protein product [Cylicocyclus nassatus]|uniref:R3H domain-containing protein n=1 Tax=Cylicocyclus nassatus TaxID=53992 RepID=A0AA36GTG5_CYLNA|nr:unnamed protein product [Cylicocyclus nassatus]